MAYLFWKFTNDRFKNDKSRDNKLIYKMGELAYSILDFVYLGISDNPHLEAKRKSDIEIYKLETNHDLEQRKKELDIRLKQQDFQPDNTDDETNKKIAEYEQRLASIKTEADYTFDDWYYKGVSEYQNQEYEKTIAYMKNAILKDAQVSNAASALVYIGLAYERMELFKKALEQHDRIIKEYPQYPFLYLAYSNRGIYLRKLGKLKEALLSTEESIKLNSKFPSVYVVQGDAYSELKDWQKAFNAYDMATHIDKNFALAWTLKANALLELKQGDEALEAIQKAISLDSKDSFNYYCKAKILAMKDNKEEMLGSLKTYFSLKPSQKKSITGDPAFKKYYDDANFKKLTE